MREEQRHDMDQLYSHLLDVQKRLRSLIESADLPVTLEEDPEWPDSVDKLAEALNVIRTNLNLAQLHLDAYDAHENGPELRTADMVRHDIEQDVFLLGNPDGYGGRTLEEIQGNIAYDQMQIRRI